MQFKIDGEIFDIDDFYYFGYYKITDLGDYIFQDKFTNLYGLSYYIDNNFSSYQFVDQRRVYLICG
jgi:hypothetical protein